MTRFEFEGGPRTRRRLLGTLGSGVAVGLAGCLGGGGNGDANEDEDETEAENGATDTDDGDDNRYAARVIDHPGDGPIEFTEDLVCPVCGMSPANYRHWHCQLAHDNGDGAAFDTPGCLFAYYAFQPVDAPVTAGWVMGIEARELIDATEAHFVLVTDKAATTDEPMGPNPRPFADREDAVAYLEEWEAEDLTEDDIIELSDVGVEEAELYRSNRLP